MGEKLWWVFQEEVSRSFSPPTPERVCARNKTSDTFFLHASARNFGLLHSGQNGTEVKSMASKWISCSSIFRTIPPVAMAALAIATVLGLMVFRPPVLTSRCDTDH